MMTLPMLGCMESGEEMTFFPCLPFSGHLFILLLEIGTVDSQGFLGSCESSFVRESLALCALRKQLGGS